MDVKGSEHRLFAEGCNAIGYGLDDAFSFSYDLEPLKAQVIPAVARSLNSRMKFDACPVFNIGILDGRHAAESEHRHIDRGRLVLQIEEVGAVTCRADGEFVRVERLNASYRSLEHDLFQMVRPRFVQNVADGDGVGGFGMGEQDKSETDREQIQL